MVTRDDILRSLDSILVPNSMRSIAKLNMIRDVRVIDSKVEVSLASTALSTEVQEWIKNKVHQTLQELNSLNDIVINYVDAKPAELNKIGHVIAIMSGKGGVGKSLVTGLLGSVLTRQGKEVGILDADITGPSIPRMFSLGGARPGGSETGILPVLSRTGLEIMSINLVLEHEDDAVIWRGPLIGKAIQQFWDEVVWGQLDYLLVDLPPGTADAPLTVLKSLPVSGVIMVFSPQELAVMVVRKAVKMANTMNIPILGVVENMSYLQLPNGGNKMEIFGKSKIDEMSKTAGTSLSVALPIDPDLARLCDEGNIEKYRFDAFEDFARTLDRDMIPKLKTI